jgi:hypothetical protein
MSAGHKAAHGKVADPALADSYYARTRELVAASILDDTHEVLYASNRTPDCTKVWRDRRIPALLPRCGVDTRESLATHECGEWLAMNDGLPYFRGSPSAHVDVATPLEERNVREQFPDDPDIVAKYNAEMDEYVDLIAASPIADPPPVAEVDQRPYDEMDVEGDEPAVEVPTAASMQVNLVRQVVSLEDFARFPRAQAAERVLIRAAGGVADLANSSGRVIRYKFSDASVARDDHTIAAWQTQNFRRNPVFLWAHQADEPPIGRVLDDLVDNAGTLTGSVEYAERDLYPFADTIFQMVKGGWLNAVSTSWDPIKWRFSTDKNRPRGIDFELVDLLEISQVPVPALPTALASARAAGIDTGPVYAWAEKILDGGGMMMVPRAELEALRREAKMPAATPASKHADPAASTSPAKPAIGKRGLYEVASLAWMMTELGYLQDSVSWEAAWEEDGSAVPGQMLAALKSLGDVLVAMTAEEVAELIANLDREPGSRQQTKGQALVLGLCRLARDASAAATRRYAIKTRSPLTIEAARRLNESFGEWLRGDPSKPLILDSGAELIVVDPLIGPPPGQEAGATRGQRAGKVLSSKNEAALRDCLDMHSRGCDMLRDVLAEATGSDGGDLVDTDEGAARTVPPPTDPAAAAARRKRQADALKRKISIQPAA